MACGGPVAVDVAVAVDILCIAARTALPMFSAKAGSFMFEARVWPTVQCAGWRSEGVR